jgi:hypothetical protein
MFRNKSVDVHQFAMIPRADIPRSAFQIQHTHKTTFDAGYLIPVYLDEVLPGDTFNVKMTAFARIATPIFPIMDNLHLDTFFFFVPNRLVWTNWKKFMGEQDNPGDSISYTIPVTQCPANGYAVNSLQDYMGLPTVGTLAGGGQIYHSAMFTRAYNLIWNEWFRSEDLQNSVVVDKGNGPDTYTDYVLLRRGKRHDYFTACLPSPQKGGTPVSVPLGTSAPVFGNGLALGLSDGTTQGGGGMAATGLGAFANVLATARGTATAGVTIGVGTAIGALTKTDVGTNFQNTGLYADLSAATAATINQLRQSFQIQKLLERDARGGTRYTEIVRAHFGVTSPDARLQRPEYLGGGSTPVSINPIAQTSGTSASGTTTALGTLAAMGTIMSNNNGFTQSFTEHGMIIGLASIRADLTYQQGLRKMWKRATRYDFYFPAFAMLGEQAVTQDEIYCRGDGGDGTVFGYQERWAEYRYNPSMITGLFRSTASGTLDGWHLAQKFTSAPTLNNTFIQDTPPMSRIVAVGSGANGQQFIFDSFFNNRVVRPMPTYSVPGLIDHF